MALGTPIHAPGVHLKEMLQRPAPAVETGVPAFLGYLSDAGKALPLFAGSPSVVPLDYSAWSALEASAGPHWAQAYLGFAVRGFFENGGQRCYVVLPGKSGITTEFLEVLDAVEDFDLVCVPPLAPSKNPDAPVITTKELLVLVEFFEPHPRCFIILDTPSDWPDGKDLSTRLGEENVSKLRKEHVALYAPWIKVREACTDCHGTGFDEGAVCKTCWGSGQGLVPPSGHVAGVYARTDRRSGVHKAPANEVLEGVVDLALHLEEGKVTDLYHGQGINCLRAFPGRGIRIWGARTLAAPNSPEFVFVNTRRVFLTVSRWLEQTLAEQVFEPNDLKLWVRITRQVGTYLEGLFRRGALVGETAAEAFYVKCDAETNPPAVRESGQVVTEVGLALTQPNEFIVVRLVSGPSGASVSSVPGGP